MDSGQAEDLFLAVFRLAYFAATGEEAEAPRAAEALRASLGRSPMCLFEASLQGEQSDLARQALELEPSFVEAHLVLGRAAAEAGRLGEAERQYETVKRALPQSAGAKSALADLFFLMGDMPRALGAYDSVIAMEPDVHALLRKGMVLTALDRPDEALPVLRQVLESHWMPGEANYWLGRNHFRKGALEQAEACVLEAKRRLPADPATLLLGGQIAVAKGLWNAAEADLTAVETLVEANEALAGTEPVCESLFLRGRVDSHREQWASGLGHFGASAECFDVSRSNADRRQEQIRGWGLSPDEERPLLFRNAAERERTKDRIAATRYDAAVCALHTGQRELAAALANEAAKRPLYEKGAEDLLKRLTPK